MAADAELLLKYQAVRSDARFKVKTLSCQLAQAHLGF